MRYVDLAKDVFSVFARDDWAAEKISIFPYHTRPSAMGVEYVTFTLLPSKPALNSRSLAGILILEIYTPVAKIPMRPLEIADELDKYLVNKSYRTGEGTTQFMTSAIEDRGSAIDAENSGLCRTLYSIPFNHFGAFK